MKRLSLVTCLILTLIICLTASSQAVIFMPKKTVERIQEKIDDLPAKGRVKTRTHLYMDLGLLQYKNGNFEEAAASLNKSLSLSPTKNQKRELYLYLGKSYESSGNLLKSIEAYEKALSFDSHNWKRSRDLAQVYELNKQYPLAIKNYEEALKRNETDVSLILSLAGLWKVLGIYNLAESYYLKSEGMGISKKTLAYDLSIVYEGQGRHQDALLAFEKKFPEDLTPEEWARFIYLAVLSSNKTFANQGMDELRKLSLPEGTMQFYESIVNLSGLSFDDTYQLQDADPAVKKIFEIILSESEK